MLWAHADAARFRHARCLPAADLAAHVEHAWVVRWDLRGVPPFRQEMLPQSVHLVVEAGHSGLAGVPRGRFTKVLTERGRAIGVKFRPGGFRALWPAPAWTLAGRVVPLPGAFGAAGAALERVMLGCDDADAEDADATGPDRWADAAGVDARMVAHLEAFVRARRLAASDDPASPDPHAGRAALVAGLVERTTRDRALATVEAVRARAASARAPCSAYSASTSA